MDGLIPSYPVNAINSTALINACCAQQLMQQPMTAACILYLPIGTIVNFGRPPNSIGGRPEKKLLVGDTARPYYQIIYKWTANF